MKLDSIHLKNFRCHANLAVNFGPGFNVVVGINGSGKTSLLKGICQSFYGLVMPMNANHPAALGDPGDVQLLAMNSGGLYRFEPQYPVVIQATGEAFAAFCTWSLTKTSQVGNPHFSGLLPSGVWQRIQQDNGPMAEATRSSTHLPLVAFYRANRHWSQPQPHELQAATQRNSRTDGYASWWDASLDAAAFQGWVIAKCLERFQTSSETGVVFDAIKNDELALANVALAAAVEGVKGLRYDLKQKSLLVDWLPDASGTRDPTAFENLSDGQRAVIGLVGDIARRMCLLNPQLGADVTTQTAGVVLIDELDMHLHPRWQRILTGGLKRAFPAVQFIVTSHSPQVIGELHPEEIILLRATGAVHPQVSYGLTSSQVLEEIMGAEARAPAVQHMVHALFHALEHNELENAREKLTELEAVASGIPELVGAQALLRRKEVLGR